MTHVHARRFALLLSIGALVTFGPTRGLERLATLTGGYRAVSAQTQPPPAATPRDVNTPPEPVALIAEYDGIIHPISAEFFAEVIDRADTSGARVAIILLRTPGGLLDSTRAMVSRMIAARTPIVIFIAPSGSRAASAGFILTLAADVAVMAPGTHIGAASPVSVTGGEADEPPSDGRGDARGRGTSTMARKVTEDSAAYARTLARARGRNETLAAEAVTEARAFTEHEALTANPPLIDFTATDVDDLLRQLNGRPIARFNGSTVTLATEGLRRESVEMSLRQQFLSAIAHPQIAYLLFSLGSLGLIVELWNPGAIVPGVAGGLCLLLAFFAFQVVPVNVAGLLLVVFGLAMLILELKVPSFGALGVGGTIALFIGSVMVTREVPDIEVSYRLIVPVVIAIAGIFVWLGRLALASQRLTTAMGADALVGGIGDALTDITPPQGGQVRMRGEIWRAVSDHAIPAGHRVRVDRVDGLTVHVQPFN